MFSKRVTACLAVTALACGATFATEVGLTSVVFPEGKSVNLPISGTQRAPAAEISAKVKHQNGQSTIEISYKDVPPALLFGGDIVSYVVWVVSPDGTFENIGGIANDEAEKATQSFATAKRAFALMITAEPIVTVRTPGELVVFFSGTPGGKDVQPTGFSFGGLSDRNGQISSDVNSIAGLTYTKDKKNPLNLIQATKAVELLDRFEVNKYDTDTYDKARATLAEATEGKGQKQIDAANQTVMLAGQALAKTVQMKRAEEEATAAAAAAAERQMLTTEAASAGASLETTQAELATTTKELEDARAQVTALQAANSKLTMETRSLDDTLTGALGAIATGSKTDRGYVVSLSGVAFESGQSELSTEAKYVLAKLSGVLLVFPDMKLAIEGHTDSTGSDEINRKLSIDRAKAVSTHLSEMGVASSRMTDAGFGPDNPIAPNDTPGGRAKNRRVDIVMMQ